VTTVPIVLLAPAPAMTFMAMPSGSTYVANQYGIVTVTNGSVADQLALIAAGCAALEPNAGGNVATQPGTAYTVQPGDENNSIVFTASSPVMVTLPNSMPVGFAVALYQGGTGQVSAQAASGGVAVTPNVAATPGPYCSLFCIVIANAGGASAQWDVICEPSQTGGGVVGAATLASLYSQDGTAHYAQYSIAQVFSDSTAGNNGFWLKTGTGNGSGNWTQQSTITLASLNTAINAETGRAEAKETFIQNTTPTVGGIWADNNSPFAIAFTDVNGNVLDGSIYLGGARYTTNPLALMVNALWADETYGLYAVTDANGNLVEGQTTASTTWPPAQLATTDRTTLDFLEFIAGALLWPDENYGIPFTDSNGNVILGVRKNGSVDIPQLNVTTSALDATDAAAMSFYESMFSRMWDEVYGLAVTDSNGNVLFGIEHNGSVDISGLNPSESEWWPFIDTNGALGTAGSLWANNGATVFRIAYPQGSGIIVPPAYLVGQGVKWSDTGVSPPELREYLFSGDSGLPSTITTIYHIPQTGESTSAGANGAPLYTTSPVAPTQAFMFNTDERTVPYPYYTAAIYDGTKAPDSTQLYLSPLQEDNAQGNGYWGETHLSGIAHSIISIGSLVSTTGLMHSAHGCSQTIAADLVRGTQPYSNLLRGVERAYAIAMQHGADTEQSVSFSVPCISYVQGINDGGTSEATWNNEVATLQANLTSDINHITGGSAQIPLFIVQYACWTSTHQSDQAAAPAQCQGMIDLYKANTSTIILVGNSYHLPWFSSADGVHMYAQGYRMQGEEIGRAMSKFLAGGASAVNPPLFATAAAASNSALSLTVTFNTTTQLSIDTSIVSDPGQYGLRLTDSSGNPIALSLIAISSTNEIAATTATALTIGGTYNLGIANYGVAGNNAGPMTGPRSCIRDSAPESYSMGGRMYRYACTQSIAVTVGA
jgi:hypothetical protein